MNERLHWFCFCFEWMFNNETVKSNAYLSLYDKDITMATIDEAKKKALVEGESVLISCSYLGLMTNEKFTSEVESI